jgi:hypothetical protein
MTKAEEIIIHFSKTIDEINDIVIDKEFIKQWRNNNVRRKII